MDIEVLNLQANADSIDKATASINNLATAIDKIDKKTSEITKSTFDLAKSLDGATKSAAKTKESIENVGEATKPLKGVERVIDNLQNTLKVLRQQTIDASDGFAQLGDGFTRSQARALANARALGATADQLKSIADLQKQLNALTSDPFDQSVGALSQISKIRSELERTMAMTEKYGDLTQEQLRMMSRGYAEIEQRIAATGGSMNQLNKETDEFTKSFLENAHAINVSKEALKAKNKAAEEEIRSQRLLADATKAANAEMMKSWAGGIGMQSDELKQMSSYYQQLGKEAEQSARMRANAEQYVQDKLERTLFINKQLEAGFGQGAANALFNYKKQIDAMGLSADQSAVKMEEFQNAVMQNQSLRSDRSPFKKMSEDIQETNRQVNHLARAVSVQLGDVFVSLASGMNPFVVAMQQGDQIRFALKQAEDAGQSLNGVMKGAFASMANSFVMVGKIVKDFIVDGIMAAGKFVTNFNVSIVDAVSNMLGFGNAATNAIKRMEESAAAGNKFDTALLGLFKTMQALTGIALIGTVSALGMLITAMIQADSQQTKLAKSVGQYGASLGIAANEARAMALASDESTSSVVNAIGAVAKAGGFTQEQLKIVTDSAVEMNRVFGVSIEDVVSQYKSLREDPVKALIELQARTGDVNNEIISKIRTMKEEGKQYQAIDLAMEEYAAANKRTTDQTVQNLGVVATLLDKMANAWRSLYKEIEQAAMGESTIQKLAAAGLRLREAEANRGKTDWFFNDYEEQYRVALQSYNLLMQRYVQENQVTAEKKKQADAAALEAKYLDDINNAKPAQIKFAEKQIQLQNDYNQALKNGASPEFLAGLSGLMQKNADEYLKSLETTSSATTKKTDDIQKYFNRLLEGASDLALNTRQELLRLQGGYEQMTDSQKKWFDAQNDPNWNKLTERQKQEYENALKFVAQNEQKIANLKTELEIKKQIAEFNETLRGLDEDIADENAELELRNNLLWATEDQAKAIQDEYNKNVSIIALENKYLVIRNKLYAQANTLIGQNPEAREQVLQQLERDLNDLNTRYGLQLNQVYSNAAIKGQEEYVAKFKEIQGTVTDIIATALFEGGKAGSKKLKDVLKAEFRKYVIKVFIEPVVGNVMGSIFGKSGSMSGVVSGSSGSGMPSFGAPDIGANIAGGFQNAGASLMGNGFSDLGEAVGNFGNTLNTWNTSLKSIPGFEGGVSSVLGYANAVGTAMDGNYGKAVGQAIGTYILPGIGTWIGGELGDMLGWEKKPSDKTSSVTVDLSTNAVKQIWDMGGKKTAPQEQKDANVLLSQIVGGFANLAGITGELVTAMGSRDGIRVAITGGFKTPEGAAGGGAWLGGKETIYSFGSDLETAIVGMLNDLVDEGKLDQALIDTWRRMGDEIDGTTRSSGELVSVLNLLTSGYEEMDIERANLLQTEGETLEQAYLRMLNVEKALKGVISTENEFTNSAKALAMEFERLGLVIPTSAEALGDIVFGLDTTSSEGQALYKTLMELAPAFLEVEAAFKSNYNLLLSEQELLDKNLNDLSKTFEVIGVAMPNSTKELRAMIDAVDMTSSAGVELKAQLLALVPAFVELTESADRFEEAFDAAKRGVDDAYSALEKAVARDKAVIQSRIDALKPQADKLSKVFDVLKKAIDNLLGNTESVSKMRTSQAMSIIASAASSGVLPSEDVLEEAVSQAVAGVEKGLYKTKVDQERANILLANDLGKIKDNAGKQLSEIKQLIEINEKELSRLDAILERAKAQVDALRGNTDLSVVEALQQMQNALVNELKFVASAIVMGLQSQSISPQSAIEQLNQAGVAITPEAWNSVQTTSGMQNVWASTGGAAAIGNTIYGKDNTKVNLSDAVSFVQQSLSKGDPLSVYTEAVKKGISSSSLDAMMGWKQGESAGWAKNQGLPAFANGGVFSDGVVSKPTVFNMGMMGEAGSEAIMPLTNVGGSLGVRAMMPDMEDVVEELQALRGETTMLRAEVRAVASNTSKTARILDDVTQDGQTIKVETVA